MLSRIKDRAARYWNSFSFAGLLCATLFFAASVTPSLVPRPWLAQGLLSGFALAAGYGVGIFFAWLWSILELPQPTDWVDRNLRRLSTVFAVIIFVWFSWQMTFWQNSIREVMEMEPVKSVSTFRICLIALVSGAVLIALARTLTSIFHWCAGKLNRLFPPRISYALSALITGFMILFVVNDVIASALLGAANDVFAELDRLIDEDVEQPQVAEACGSAESLIEWDSIGRFGRNFITGLPEADSLRDFRNSAVQRPIRVYAGYRSGTTHRQRASLALDELKRVGAFERSLVVVATPTGTGWLDPGAVDSLEYLHGGDTAIVATQYSYLPSWMTLLVDSNRSIESARALFDAVYSHWRTLPIDRRPRLFLHGLSLGSLGSELSADLFTILEDPIQGAVWSGPPFPSSHWAKLTRDRNSGSPAWLPEFRDGAMVRFTAQDNALNAHDHWGPFRCVYIQYASDPMVFFSPDLMFKTPEWLIGDRGPDVSPHLRWLPIVTCLQVAFDLPFATGVPSGYGHNYSPSSYIDAWIAVTDPSDWDEFDTQRLKEHFANPSAP
ncbi:MAG: alpha/beta-hydrolase family protein [Planctomycetaceae bacterium]